MQVSICDFGEAFRYNNGEDWSIHSVEIVSVSEHHTRCFMVFAKPGKKQQLTSYKIRQLEYRDSSMDPIKERLYFPESHVYRKLLPLEASLDQVLSFGTNAETMRVYLKLHLVAQGQFQDLLSFPHESSDSFMHSRLSPSKATLALVLKPDQVAVVMETLTDNWHENLGQNICKVSLPSDAKILDLALWDTEGCNIDGFNSGKRKAFLAVIFTDLSLSFSVVERGLLSNKWTAQSWQSKLRSIPSLDDGLEKEDIKKTKLLGLHVSLGVFMVLYAVEGMSDMLIVDQYKFDGQNSHKNDQQHMSGNSGGMKPLTDMTTQGSPQNSNPASISKQTPIIQESKKQEFLTLTSELDSSSDANVSTKRDSIKLNFPIDKIEDVQNAVSCLFSSSPAEKLKIILAHRDLQYLGLVNFDFNSYDNFFSLTTNTTLIGENDIRGLSLSSRVPPFVQGSTVHLYSEPSSW